MWTEKEVSSYRPRMHALGLYESKGLADAHPEQRAEFMSDYLGLTMTDHDVIMRLAAGNGRPVALNLMEDMIVTRALD